MDYSIARSDSKSLYLIHYRLLLLLVIFLLILFPSTMASIDDVLCTEDCGGTPEDQYVSVFDKIKKRDNKQEESITMFEEIKKGDGAEEGMLLTVFEKTNKHDHDHEASGNKHHPVSDEHCNCPPVRECPLTLESKAWEQLKENLAPVIRHRLSDLLKKAITVESATEAAHTIDLLKILNASNSKLDRIRDNMYEAAQTLKSASAEIPEYVYVAN